MAKLEEPLDGGLVTSKSKLLLSPGQLTESQNVMLLPGVDGLVVADHRTSAGTVNAAADVEGLDVIKFDSGAEYLIAHDAINHYSSTPGTSLTFSSLGAAGAGNTLRAIHYDNRFFTVNGAQNKVLYLNSSTLTMRAHGLTQNQRAPTVSTVTATWTLELSRAYEYWITEVVEFTEGSSVYTLESSTTPQGVTTWPGTSVTTSAPRIFKPTFTNSNVARWRLYRSAQSKDPNQTGVVLFPNGVLIAELDDTVTSITDSASIAANTETHTPGALVSDDWDNAGPIADIQSDNSVYYSTVVETTDRTDTVTVGTFGFSTVTSAAINGIRVILTDQARNSGTAYVTGTVVLTTTNGGGKTASKSFDWSTSGDVTTTVGSASDTWGVTWTGADFADGVFTVSIIVSHEAAANTATVHFDMLQVTINYGATIQGSLGEYPAYTIQQAGGAISGSLFGPPATASTGDIFEDSLVLNDTSKPSRVRYSVSGFPEYFADIYYINIQSEENDSITCIRTLGNVLIVGTGTSLWRINYLPRETDAEFVRGRVMDRIDRQHGIVGPQAATLYTVPGGRTELAFVSNSGIYTTDGFQVRLLSGNLSWSEFTPGAAVADVQLIDNAVHHCLMAVINRDRIYRIHYHPKFSGADNPVITGPAFIANGSNRITSAVFYNTATATPLAFFGAGVAGADRGLVFYQQPSVNGGGNPTLFSESAAFTTRSIAPVGYGNETELHNAYWLGTMDPGDSITSTAFKSDSNLTSTKTSTPDTVTMGSGRAPIALIGEWFTFRYVFVTAGASQNLVRLVLEHEPAGDSDSGG